MKTCTVLITAKHIDTATTKRGRAVCDGESFKHRISPQAASKGDDANSQPRTVDGRHVPTAGASHNDRLSDKVDRLVVDAWCYDDLIAVDGSVDAPLD